MRPRQFQILESKAQTLAEQTFELELEGRSQLELMFFSVHGYWPEAAAVSERDE